METMFSINIHYVYRQQNDYAHLKRSRNTL